MHSESIDGTWIRVPDPIISKGSHAVLTSYMVKRIYWMFFCLFLLYYLLHLKWDHRIMMTCMLYMWGEL